MGLLQTQIPETRVYEKRLEVAESLAQRALNSSSLDIASAEDLVVRDLLPAEDLDSGDENGWSSDAEWRQDWNASGSGDAWNEAYEVDSTARADDKILAIYGLQFPSGTIVTREFRALIGTGGTQGVKAWVNVEEMENDEEATGIFAEEIVYGATENGSIEHWIEDATDGNRFRYLALVAEQAGDTLSNAQNPLLGSGGQ